METKQVATGLGTVWLKKGWSLFRKDPILWVILTCIWVAVMVGLLVIPWIGATIMWILGPVIYAGFIYAASELDQSRELRAEYLFRGLMDREKRMPFITLGAISFALFMILMSVGRTFFMVEWIPSGEPQLGDILSILLRVLLITLLGLLMFITLTYSGPSIMFRGTEPFEALMSSAGACLKNWRPLLVFCGIYLLPSILATILVVYGFSVLTPAFSFLGYLVLIPVYLVLIPVTFSALYYSYKNIYGVA